MNLDIEPRRISGFSNYTITIDGVICHEGVQLNPQHCNIEPLRTYDTETDKFLELTDTYVWLLNDLGCKEYRSVRRLVYDTFCCVYVNPMDTFRYTSLVRGIDGSPIKHYSVPLSLGSNMSSIRRLIPGFNYCMHEHGTVYDVEFNTTITSQFINNETYYCLPSLDGEIVYAKAKTLFCMAFKRIPVGIEMNRLMVHDSKEVGMMKYDLNWCEYIGH